MGKRLSKTYHCATEFTLAVLDGKWKTVILCYLKEGPCRYAELRQLIPGLTDKMLTERLRQLVASGLVEHRPKQLNRFATYALSSKGRSLDALLQHIYAWGLENCATFDVAVGEPLKQLRERRPQAVRTRVA